MTPLDSPNDIPKDGGIGNNIGSSKTFSDVIMDENHSCFPSAKFFFVASKDEDTFTGNGGMEGKFPPNIAIIYPNEEMHNTIFNERNRILNVALFVAAIDLENLLGRNFMENWLINV